MFDQAISTIKQIWRNQKLRYKLLFTAGIFLLFRLLAHIPVPAVDTNQLQSIFAGSQFLSFLNIFSGGTLARFSIVAVGIQPYITASIIMQLASMVFPKLKELQKEGEAGRQQVNQYTRLLTVPLGIFQSLSVIALLNSQGLIQTQEPLALTAIITTLVAGSMIMMWLGELVSLHGIGNGISMVLFAGIVSQVPVAVAQLATAVTSQQLTVILSFAVILLAVIGLVVFMNQAVRKIPIQYAKRVRGSRVYGGQRTHLPVRVNVAGVMPIIFAVSLMLVPSFLGQLLVKSSNQSLVELGQNLTIWFNQTSPIYMIVYFLLVFGFSFFSALVFFNAEDLAAELKKSGAFIPGVRPGGPTKKFLEYVVIRITLVGAVFLGFIALLPALAQLFTGVQSLAIGGTSVLIVVSVVLETAKQVESMLVGQNYEQYT
ncbi:MAG: preprotein translocase subunit SecY [Candidatus Pacebacteria bacterium]|nr:preprotein translocase subunit SecY [Candidatus Paceibacterota bacterium]